jgi:hypothetical protein
MKHKHHIIPKHAGGSNDPDNLVLLTVEEHAQAHKELYEKYGRWQDYYAWQGLSGQISKEEIITGIYANRKSRLGVILTDDTKAKISMAKRGYKLSEEHKAKINPTGRKQPKTQKEKVAKALSKRWLITDPEGNTFEIENLRAFGKEHNVDQGNLIKHGKSKGYVCLPL